ncbi:DUF6538 domain-containing protein [Dethiosulfatarculus sandiegensis]
MACSTPSYLQKRSQIYYFRARVPKHLLKRCGCTEFCLGLKKVVDPTF